MGLIHEYEKWKATPEAEEQTSIAKDSFNEFINAKVAEKGEHWRYPTRTLINALMFLESFQRMDHLMIIAPEVEPLWHKMVTSYISKVITSSLRNNGIELSSDEYDAFIDEASAVVSNVTKKVVELHDKAHQK